MRVVLDANVFISFLLTRGETIASLFDLWEKKQITPLVTEEILVEIAQVVERLEKKKIISTKEGAAFKRRLKKNTVLTQSFSFVDAASDKKDNRYLACALDAKANFLITGDKKHLLALGEFAGVKIVSPREFLKIISYK